MEPTLEASPWDKLITWLAHPVRLFAWIVALGVTVGPIGGISWILVAAAGVLAGLVGGELLGRSRLRSPVVLATLVGTWFLAGALRWFATRYGLAPSLLGPLWTHWLGLLLSIGAGIGVVLGSLRMAARRGPAFNVIELGLLGALLAGAVSAHRDGSIARPLWLSDLSWSFGVDPGRVLLAGGALMTALLASLLLLGSERRKPLTGLLLLPFLALFALLFTTSLPALDPPDPAAQLGMDVMDGDGEGDAKGGGGEGGEGGEGDDANGQGGDASGSGREDGGGKGSGEDPNSEGKGGQSDQPPDPLAGGSGSANRPVAVVLLDDDHEPPSGYWYLRQDVLPAYNGTRLVPSDLPGSHADTLDHFAVKPEQLELSFLKRRKTVRGSVSLLVDHPTPFAPASPIAYAPRGNPNPARFKRSYSFASAMLDVPYGDLIKEPVGDPLWSEELRGLYLDGPENPAYGELADKIIADLRVELGDRFPADQPLPPVLKALAVVIWIGDNMKYSRSERHADVADPTADFLFGNRIGYCVHNAHASVYLWRYLGIPSRVATGYAVEAEKRRGGTLVVMSGDAHAWPEFYLEGIGWVPLDVAPSEDLDASEDATPPDEEELRALGDLARDAPDLPGPRPDYSWIWSFLGYTTTGILVALSVLLLGLHGLLKVWRRTGPRWASPKSLSRVGYRAALDLLTDSGFVRRPGETREAFARRLYEHVPSFREITNLHLRGALGSPSKNDPERDRVLWNRSLKTLRHELRQTVPLWRRLLGFFDPSTPYRSR